MIIGLSTHWLAFLGFSREQLLLGAGVYAFFITMAWWDKRKKKREAGEHRGFEVITPQPAAPVDEGSEAKD